MNTAQKPTFSFWRKIRSCFWLICLSVVGWPEVSEAREFTLPGGSRVEFASVADGRVILGRTDEFISAIGPLDLALRLKTNGPVTAENLLSYARNQVQPWSAAEQERIIGILNDFSETISDLDLAFPPVIHFVKSTGNEEGGTAAYVRGTAVVFSQASIASHANVLRHIVAHELFHVFAAHNSHWKPALFRILGYQPAGKITLPQSIAQRRITNNPFFQKNPYFITLVLRDRQTPFIPIILSKSTNYVSGNLIDHVDLHFIELERTADGFKVASANDGEVRLWSPSELTDLQEQFGRNTSYILDPEETLADNFSSMLRGITWLNAPRIQAQLRIVLKNGPHSTSTLPAGRAAAIFETTSTSRQLIEYSHDLRQWRPWDYIQPANGKVVVLDPTAWLKPRGFLRIRSSPPSSIDPGDTNRLAWIPPGELRLGSPASEVDRATDEGPQTVVEIESGFWIGKFEVTQGEFQEVIGTNVSFFKDEAILPVEQVTWDEAMEYCNRLTQREQNLGRLPTGFIYRLPTEAEWEYAARAGSTTRFNYGDDPSRTNTYVNFWFSDNSNSRTHPGGAFPPNAWGLYEMHGNVGEWCLDWYAPYPGGSARNPSGPSNGREKVYRGGMFLSPPVHARSASRGKTLPEVRVNSIGFRIVLGTPITQ